MVQRAFDCEMCLGGGIVMAVMSLGGGIVMPVDDDAIQRRIAVTSSDRLRRGIFVK